MAYLQSVDDENEGKPAANRARRSGDFMLVFPLKGRP